MVMHTHEGLTKGGGGGGSAPFNNSALGGVGLGWGRGSHATHSHSLAPPPHPLKRFGPIFCQAFD